MMPQERAVVGIDVDSRELEVRELSSAKGWRVANRPAGWAKLARLWAGRGVVVGVEPSGGYEQGLVRTLTEAGVEVRWADPSRVRALATALGAPAKTDAIDAALIARSVAETGGRPVERDPERQALRELLAARQAAMETADRLAGQAQMLAVGNARDALERLAAQARRRQGADPPAAGGAG